DSDNRSPENSLTIIAGEQLHRGLYAYTAIHAPRGLNERIYHEWRLNGQVVDRVALDINGGREAGYRAWSHKVNFPEQSLGRWQIHVVTEANQLIGMLRFRVVEQVPQGAAVSSAIAVPPPVPETPDSAMKAQLKELGEEAQ
ncbi:MAG: hypothetical protein K0Q67_1834, partial [Cellvibrio sp.]|nr:hypothetical protein [Cellvibrio sp.]